MAHSKQVWAFYLGFWLGEGSWNMQANTLIDRPSRGFYDSRHTDVIAGQIAEAKNAGIDAFIVSWFGVSNPETTTVFNTMLDVAAANDFKIGVAVDVYEADFNRNRDSITQSLQYIVNEKINHPAYMLHDGKPVIFFAFQGRSNFSDDVWAQVRNDSDPGRTTLWIAEGLSACCLYGGVMDGMYAFNIAWSNGNPASYQREKNALSNALYIPTVHPGWDEDKIAAIQGRSNPTSRRDRAGGQFLKDTWNGAMSVDPEVVIIISWNEFVENSHIEPSQVYGTQSLDTLKPLVAAWKGTSTPAPEPTPVETTPAATTEPTPVTPSTEVAAPPTVAQPEPELPAPIAETSAAPPPTEKVSRFLEANTVLNVRTGAGTQNAQIGQVLPGRTYPIIGEEAGWYAISFEGGTGYVSAEYVTVTQAQTSTEPLTGLTFTVTPASNLRNGPGTTFDRIGGLPEGASSDVIGRNAESTWVKVSYNGLVGWLFAELGTLSGTMSLLPVVE